MIKCCAMFVMSALLGLASPARGLDLTAGPSDTLPGGGSCTVSGNLGKGNGATWTCTIPNPGSFADVYFGVANSASVNGNQMDGSGPSGFEVFRYAGHTTDSITYTSSTTVDDVLGSSTQAVNTRIVVTLVSGAGDVMDAGGTPADNGNGDIDKLFRITSSSFSVRVAMESNTSPIPAFGESNANVFDPTHTTSSARNTTRIHLAFYYKEC